MIFPPSPTRNDVFPYHDYCNNKRAEISAPSPSVLVYEYSSVLCASNDAAANYTMMTLMILRAIRHQTESRFVLLTPCSPAYRPVHWSLQYEKLRVTGKIFTAAPK